MYLKWLGFPETQIMMMMLICHRNEQRRPSRLWDDMLLPYSLLMIVQYIEVNLKPMNDQEDDNFKAKKHFFLNHHLWRQIWQFDVLVLHMKSTWFLHCHQGYCSKHAPANHFLSVLIEANVNSTKRSNWQSCKPFDNMDFQIPWWSLAWMPILLPVRGWGSTYLSLLI